MDLRDLAEEHIFYINAARIKDPFKFILKFYLNAVAMRADDRGIIKTGKYHANTAANGRSDDLGYKVLANGLPNRRNLVNIKTKQNRAFNTNPFAILGYRGDGNITESSFVGRVKLAGDAVFKSLDIEKLGFLPERDLEVKTGSENFLQNTSSEIVNTSNVSRWYINEKSLQNIVNDE